MDREVSVIAEKDDTEKHTCSMMSLIELYPLFSKPIVLEHINSS